MKNLSPLAQRVLSAVLGIPLLVGVCLWGVIPFVILTVVLALLSRFEITHAYRHLKIRPNGLLSLMGALLPATVLFLPRTSEGVLPSAPPEAILLLACGLIAASLYETAKASHTNHMHPGRNLAYGCLCGAYVSLFSGVALLRCFPWRVATATQIPIDGGAALVLVSMFCAMASDTGAFFVGRAFGKHKLAVLLSPNKTTEGLFGGMASSVLIGAMAGHFLLGSVGFGLLVGISAGFLGPLGDLFKSALKREIGIKDFGTIIPGHGGVLDRFDSLLFTAPVVLLLAHTVARIHP